MSSNPGLCERGVERPSSVPGLCGVVVCVFWEEVGDVVVEFVVGEDEEIFRVVFTGMTTLNQKIFKNS